MKPQKKTPARRQLGSHKFIWARTCGMTNFDNSQYFYFVKYFQKDSLMCIGFQVGPGPAAKKILHERPVSRIRHRIPILFLISPTVTDLKLIPNLVIHNFFILQTTNNNSRGDIYFFSKLFNCIK